MIHDAPLGHTIMRCAHQRPQQVSSWWQPNALLTTVIVGVHEALPCSMSDLSVSSLPAPASRVSESKSDASLHTSAHAPIPDGFSAKFDPAYGAYVLEAAYLSEAVYVDEQIRANLELAKPGSRQIRIQNSFFETVILVENRSVWNLKETAEARIVLTLVAAIRVIG